MAAMLGYDTPEELIASIQDISSQLSVEPPGREHIQQHIERDGEVKGQEFKMIRRDGSSIRVSRSVKAVRDRDGKIIHYRGFITELTERKRVVEELNMFILNP